MFVQTSQQVRHFIGRLERGENVHEAFIALAQAQNITGGEIRAVGAFESATLGAFDQVNRKDRPPRRFATPMELLSLSGTLSLQDGDPVVHLYATVSRETDNGVEVLGGRLFAAQAFAVEFTVVAYDDATLERSLDAATGMHLWQKTDAPGRPLPSVPEIRHRSVPRAVPVETAHPTVSASRSMDAPPGQPVSLPPRFVRPEEPEFTGEITAGDHLVHPKFGDVEVVALTDSGRLEIRLPTGAKKEISVEVFEIKARPDHDGHKVWMLTNKVTR